MTTKIPVELSSTPGISDSSNATAITIDSSENVGLGARLSVGTTTVGGGNTKIVATGGTDNYLQLVSNTGSGGVSLGNAGSVFLLYSHTGALGSESFSERMRIDSSGNVGIATTDMNSHRMAIDSGSGTSLGLMHKSSNTFTLMTFKASGSTQDIRLGATGNDMIFQTNGTERMRVHSDGRVNIGGSGDGGKFYLYGDTSASYLSRFHHDGNDNDRYGIRIIVGSDSASTGQYWLRFDDGDGHAQGYMYHASGTVQIEQASDERLKENIVDSTLEGINTLKNIKQREFNWKRDPNKEKVIGYIAQELETVYPIAVHTNTDKSGEGVTAPEDDPDNPYKYLAKERLIDVLIKAGQEQQVIIEDLKARIETLEG